LEKLKEKSIELIIIYKRKQLCLGFFETSRNILENVDINFIKVYYKVINALGGIPMKKIWLIMTTLVLSITLIGCNNQEEEGVYSLATWAAGTELSELQEIVDEVNEEAEGEFEIKINSIPSNYYQQIAVLMGARQAPDMFWLTQEIVPKYAHDLGALADISDNLEDSEKLNLDDYYEGVIESTYYDGSYWGLPWISNPLVVYYNQDLFDQAGVEAPSETDDWDWNEFIDKAEALTGETNHNGDDVYGTVIDGWPNLETFLWSGGGDVIADDYETIVLDSEASINGLDNLHEMITKGITPRYGIVDSLGGNNVWFERQQAAMFMGGVQDDFEEKIERMDEEDKFELGYAPMPTNLDGSKSSFNWTASTVLHKSNEDDPLAYEAMEALTLKIFDWKIAPPVKDSTDKIIDSNPDKEAMIPTIEHTLQFARSGHYIPEWDGTSGINDRLWYDLYLQMLRDEDFDYVSAAEDIADFSRDLIGERE